MKRDGAFGACLLDIEHPYAARVDNNRVEMDEAYQRGGIVKLAQDFFHASRIVQHVMIIVEEYVDFLRIGVPYSRCYLLQFFIRVAVAVPGGSTVHPQID